MGLHVLRCSCIWRKYIRLGCFWDHKYVREVSWSCDFYWSWCGAVECQSGYWHGCYVQPYPCIWCKLIRLGCYRGKSHSHPVFIVFILPHPGWRATYYVVPSNKCSSLLLRGIPTVLSTSYMFLNASSFAGAGPDKLNVSFIGFYSNTAHSSQQQIVSFRRRNPILSN
jgi:hypothetical protein